MNELLKEMEHQRQVNSLANWFLLIIILSELIVATTITWWLTLGLQGILLAIVGVLVLTVAFIIIDAGRVAFFSWLIPSIVNCLKGYKMPDKQETD